MKTMFIPVKKKLKLNKKKIIQISKKLPKNLAIVYSIQYKDLAFEIKKELEKKHNVKNFFQILGCSKPGFSKSVKAILLIGDGRFHATSLACESNLPVYLFDFYNLGKISKRDVDNFNKRKKAAYVNFLNSEKFGILISTKPGQENLQRAIAFKKNLKNKKPYLFISNNIDKNEFQNFGLKSWVNTACPRLDFDDFRIINLRDLNIRQIKHSF